MNTLRMLFLAVVALGVVLVGTAVSASPDPPPDKTVVGIDADPSGNTATSLGSIDRCIEVSSGQTFDIDVFVDAIPEDRDLAGFQYWLNYDPTKLQVNACNHHMLLASQPGSDLLELSDEPCKTGSPPDTDGTLLVGAADLAAAPEPGGSLGVLGRYRFEAVGSGTSVLTLSAVGGTIVVDSSPAFIPVDEIHDGNWMPQYGVIAVDADMDGDGVNDCEDPDTDGDGFSDTAEQWMSTDELADCPTDYGTDAWPPDIDMSTDIAVADVIKGFLGKVLVAEKYDRRADFNMDGGLATADVIIGYYGRIFASCTS